MLRYLVIYLARTNGLNKEGPGYVEETTNPQQPGVHTINVTIAQDGLNRKQAAKAIANTLEVERRVSVIPQKDHWYRLLCILKT